MSFAIAPSDPIILKPGDTVSRIVLTLRDRRTGIPLDLTSALSIKLKYDGAATGVRDMTVEGSPLEGTVAYQVQANDFPFVGRCSAQGEVTFQGLKPLTSDEVEILVSRKIKGT